MPESNSNAQIESLDDRAQFYSATSLKVKMSDFSEWITEQINERGWKKSELAKRSGLDRSYTFQIIAGKRRPGAVACRAIAKGLDVPEVTVFRQIGYLTEDPVIDPSVETFITILSQLSEEDQSELLEIAKLKLDRQNRLQKNK